MIDPATLTRDGALDPVAIDACQADPAAIAAGLAATSDPAARAALALVAGERNARACIDALLSLLDDDGLAGRAAAWALGGLDAEGPLLAAVAEGGLDVRENGYTALARIAARGTASPGLADAVRDLLQREHDRAAQGRTGLGEYACRILAILGAEGTEATIQATIAAEPLCDKFELQRQAKQLAAEGCDRESIAELTAPWCEHFADDLAADATPIADDAPPPEAPPPTDAAEVPADESAAPEDQTGEEEEELPQPIDWQAFTTSDQAAGMDPQQQQMALQFGPMLEQLAIRAIRAPLTDLSGQEFAALLLQVLPQALPPQMVQAALSPQALDIFQALAKWLVATGDARADLVDGVKMVRQALQEQVRSSGILGGPDYSDPDEPKLA